MYGTRLAGRTILIEVPKKPDIAQFNEATKEGEIIKKPSCINGHSFRMKRSSLDFCCTKN